MESQQKRWFLALLLCAAAAVLWQMFIAKPPPRPTEAPPTAAVEGTGSGSGLEPTPSLGATGPAEAEPAQPEAPQQVLAVGQDVEPVEILEPQTLQGRGFLVRFSNTGAVLVDHRIEEPEQYIPREGFTGIFPGGVEEQPTLELLVEGLEDLTERSPYRFVADESLLAPGSDADPPVYQRLVYRWSNGLVEIDKVIEPDPEKPYVLQLQLIFRNLQQRQQEVRAVEILMWADDTVTARRGMLNPIANTRQVACLVDDSLEKESRDKIEGQQFSGPTRWAGVHDRYFLAAATLPEGTAASGCRFERREGLIGGVLRLEGFTLQPGEEHRLALRTYTGPKDESSLKVAGSQLSRSVDYGLFGFLARPMKWLLSAFHRLIPNWGVAIILLTILVKVLMWPWTQKSFKSMERMKAIQPKMQALKEKYGNDKTKLTEETMKLYREHNVSPFGCLPMLLQMPIYIALYRMIYSSVELYKADFALWVKDLSQPDPTYILPILMTATMFGQQLLTPTTSDNPQMKWMMRLMPLMFGFFMLVLPSGLVLYIFASSLLGIIQQYLIRRQFAKPALAAAPAAPAENEGRPQRRRRERRQAK
ncbi:MAG: membrane protein insertase YidC [Bradymonadales bacterium]|nr:membrane protein insertase YidC [Bradymonadales bacterium]